MTPEQFTYWLQGFVELHGEVPTEAQWTSIKEHLQTVFLKVTPRIGGGGCLSEWPLRFMEAKINDVDPPPVKITC